MTLQMQTILIELLGPMIREVLVVSIPFLPDTSQNAGPNSVPEAGLNTLANHGYLPRK